MWNVCYGCGLYRADKTIDPVGPAAICPACGHRHPFRQLPLLMVSGASGAGKSAVCQELLGCTEEAVLLDADILWRPEFDQPETQYRDFFATWLRVAKNISQAGRPVVLFGAGIGVPANIEPCVERRYFTQVYYLALVCAEETLATRLRQRPAWRESGGEEFVASQVSFNRWFQTRPPENTPAIELVDTTDAAIESTKQTVTKWIRSHL